MKLQHRALVRLLRKAYSAERAAAFAYIGHAGSLKDPDEKDKVKQIEQDEWNHREAVLKIMKEYDIAPSRWYEIQFYLIGKIIALSCYLIGRFMPFFFAGSLESGNVCEYFVMMHYFHSLGIRKHDQILYEMGMKEKEHEIYFSEMIKDDRWLPFFERWFGWGPTKSHNDVPETDALPVETSHQYCHKANPESQSISDEHTT